MHRIKQFVINLGFLLFIISVALLKTTNTSEASSEINTSNINGFFIPGKDAFWLKDPAKPSQKILLIPSMHTRSIRWGMNNELRKLILKGDILVVESAIDTMSWEDGNKFVDHIRRNVNLYKTKIIKDTPFDYEEKPWTTTFREKHPREFDYLKTKIEPYLKGFIPTQNRTDMLLSHIHPKFIKKILQILVPEIDSKMFYGMDYQISKQYQLANKKILLLETNEDREKISGESYSIDFCPYEHTATVPLSDCRKDTIKDFNKISLFIEKIQHLNEIFAQKTPNELFEENDRNLNMLKNHYEQEEMLKKKQDLSIQTQRELIDIKEELNIDPTENMELLIELLEIKNETSEKIRTKDAELISRNHLWISKIKRYLDENSDKFIVIVAGAKHFSGPEGILQLLQDEGYMINSLINPS